MWAYSLLAVTSNVSFAASMLTVNHIGRWSWEMLEAESRPVEPPGSTLGSKRDSEHDCAHNVIGAKPTDDLRWGRR